MLTQEQNETLTRVGPGTPCGELLRRYWQPVCFAKELRADHPVKRVRLEPPLGEAKHPIGRGHPQAVVVADRPAARLDQLTQRCPRAAGVDERPRGQPGAVGERGPGDDRTLGADVRQRGVEPDVHSGQLG